MQLTSKEIGNHDALNRILQAACKGDDLTTTLSECLNILLSVDWLCLLQKGGIFLTSNKDNCQVLDLVAEKNLGPMITTLCRQVAFGYCLCGRAALAKKIIHASCIDDHHEISYEGMEPHGHYNISLLGSDNQVLGVVVLYLPHGHQRQKDEEQFLERVADTLSLVIQLHQKEIDLQNSLNELEFQKSALDEHAIVSITDTKGRITYVNTKFCEVSGYNSDELMGNNHRILKSGIHTKAFYEELWGTISAGKIWHGDIANRGKDGTLYWVHSTILPQLDESGKPFSIHRNSHRDHGTEKSRDRFGRCEGSR